MWRVSHPGSLLLRCTGADRVRWLNGQVSQDVKSLTPGLTKAACICNLKGGLEGLACIAATPDALWIHADPALRDSLPARLERYIIADDVTLEDLSDTWTCHHINATTIPPSDTLGAFITASQRYGTNGWDVWNPHGTTSPALAAIPHLDTDALTALRVQHGVPAWGHELTPGLLPAEARLEASAISWDKGCYTGQEVVSRMKMAGKTNQLLQRLQLPPETPTTVPTPLLTPDGTEAGFLTTIVGTHALGMIKRKATSTTLHLPSGATVTLLPW